MRRLITHGERERERRHPEHTTIDRGNKQDQAEHESKDDVLFCVFRRDASSSCSLAARRVWSAHKSHHSRRRRLRRRRSGDDPCFVHREGRWRRWWCLSGPLESLVAVIVGDDGSAERHRTRTFGVRPPGASHSVENSTAPDGRHPKHPPSRCLHR